MSSRRKSSNYIQNFDNLGPKQRTYASKSSKITDFHVRSAEDGLVLLAVGFLAAQFPGLRFPLKCMVLVGLLFDFLLGIALHIHLLHSNIQSGLGTITTFNWQIKQRVGLIFLGDRVASWGPMLQVVFLVTGIAMVIVLAVIGRGSGATARNRIDCLRN